MPSIQLGNSPFNMGETASQASLVISQSSVRGLDDACTIVFANLVVRMGGAKALALMVKAAAKERERICMVVLW
jgi:hypothetical protein